MPERGTNAMTLDLRDTARATFAVALLFGIVYNVSFNVLPPATMGRLAMVFLIWHQWPRLREMCRLFWRENAVLCVVVGLVYLRTVAIFVLARVPDTTLLQRQAYFIFICLLGGVVYAGYLKGDRDRFVRLFAITVATQAALIVFSFFSPEYRAWVGSVLVSRGQDEIGAGLRPPGFVNSMSSHISIVQALGVCAALWVASRARSRWQGFTYYLLAVVSTLSAFLVGRTGLAVSGFFWIFFAVVNLRQRRLVMPLSMAGVLACFIVFGTLISDFLIQSQSENTVSMQYLLHWALEFFATGGETRSVGVFKEMPIPPLQWESIIGTGYVERDGIRATGHDSGYIQAYYAMGLLVTIVFYGALAWYMYQITRRSDHRLLVGILSLILFIIEIKEPYTLKYVYVFFMTSLYFQKRWGERLAAGPAESTA